MTNHDEPMANEETPRRGVEDLADGLSSRQLLDFQLLDVISSLAKAAEKAEPHTDSHQHATAEFALSLAAKIGLSAASARLIHLGARLHDIGKIGVPQQLLLLPRKLTAAEFAVVKQHCHIGKEIVCNIDFGLPIATVIEQHHERLDGSGYPNGLTGAAIMSEAMVVAVADIVDAMRSNRGYRRAMKLDAIIVSLEKESGSGLPSAYIDAAIDQLRQKV
jgi:putative nucleotidyltransferase with HDIG domain